MKKLQEDAKERVASRYNSHPLYSSIKKTELEWFDMSKNYRLSAEQVFYEVISAIDELKEQECKVDWNNLYKKYVIDFRQSVPIPTDDREINDIVTIVMISLFSSLALSENQVLQTLAGKLAYQCAENNEGYYRKFQNTFCIFDQFANKIEEWIDRYLTSKEYLSDQLELLIHPNHYSQYLKRGLNLGKSDDEVQANFANAARQGATALVKYLITNEGKVYFDFLGHSKFQIVENINRELGTTIKSNSFRQAIDRSIEKPKL